MSADILEHAVRKFSDEAIRILWNARSIVSETGSQTLGDEHLLLAVTRTTPSAVSRFATSDSWALADMQLALYESLPVAPPLTREFDVPLTERATAVVMAACKAAGSQLVLPEHLVLAMLTEGVAARSALGAAGVHSEAMAAFVSAAPAGKRP